MPKETITIGPYADEQIAKLSDLSARVFSVLEAFEIENPDMTEDLIMRNLAYDIGTWIAHKHEDWYRSEVNHTLRFYQTWVQVGLDEGMKTWGKPCSKTT